MEKIIFIAFMMSGMSAKAQIPVFHQKPITIHCDSILRIHKEFILVIDGEISTKPPFGLGRLHHAKYTPIDIYGEAMKTQDLTVNSYPVQTRGVVGVNYSFGADYDTKITLEYIRDSASVKGFPAEFTGKIELSKAPGTIPLVCAYL